MTAPQSAYLLLKPFHQPGVHNTGVAVVFDYNNRLVRAGLVQIPAADQFSLCHGIRGRAEGDKGLFVVALFLGKFSYHLFYLCV